MNFNFPDTPPYTPPRDDFSRYLQPTSSSTPIQDDFSRYLQASPHFLEPQEPWWESSFSFFDETKPESLSPLRNRLKNIAPLPSRPTIDNFARSITQMTDEKNNTITITLKRPVPKIGETNLSEQLQSIFPDIEQTIKQECETFKEKIDDLDKIIEKVNNIGDDQNEQKIFAFEFFTGGYNQKFDSFVCSKGLSTENQEFVEFLQWDLCKEISESNNLKMYIETGNIYYKNKDTNESIFEFIKNQQGSSKGMINYDLSFEGDFKDYFIWIINDYDSYQKTKFDLLTLKKYLQNI